MDTSIQYGMTLSSEEHPPRRLLEIAVLAEEHGFDFVSISDHYHPWVDEQGHSPFVWSMLGALAARTSRLDVGVGVTCPIMRIHPAILAQATATCAQLFDRSASRGASAPARRSTSTSSVTAGRPPTCASTCSRRPSTSSASCGRGDEVTHRGAHFTVENARVYDAAGAAAADRRVGVRSGGRRGGGRIGDGLWVTGAAAEIVEQWRDAGGRGPVYAQLTLCWAEDRGRGGQDRPPHLAQHRRAGPAEPGPARRRPTSSRRRRSSPRSRSPSRWPAARIPSR